MLPPSGDQFAIEGGGYRAVVTESRRRAAAARARRPAARRRLRRGRDGQRRPRPAADAVAEPDPGRRLHLRRLRAPQLALTEPSRHNASHGLARWAAWTVEEHTANSVSLGYRLMAQTGYPWTVDLHVLYDLSADGLTVTQTATNMSGSPAPYAQGAHPYLVAGPGPVDAGSSRCRPPRGCSWTTGCSRSAARTSTARRTTSGWRARSRDTVLNDALHRPRRGTPTASRR